MRVGSAVRTPLYDRHVDEIEKGFTSAAAHSADGVSPGSSSRSLLARATGPLDDGVPLGKTAGPPR